VLALFLDAAPPAQTVNERQWRRLCNGKGNWDLGLQIGGCSAGPYLPHGGVNEGLESRFVAYEHDGDGAVV
jgi:hypothetical protein